MKVIEQFTSHSEDETIQWALKFSQCLKQGDSVGLNGTLGAGKTVMSKGLSLGLGYHEAVTSPSYSLINEYQSKNGFKIYHIDLYRLDEDADWEEIGLDYYTSENGICLIEWPERSPDLTSLTYQIDLTWKSESEREIILKQS